MSKNLDTFLAQSPEICGGRLRIDGTRITVHQIVTLYKSGSSPEEIADQYPHLELAQVYAAIGWYNTNRQEFEAELAAELDEARRLEAQYGEIRQRSA